MRLRSRWAHRKRREAWKRHNPETYYAYLLTRKWYRLWVILKGRFWYLARRLHWRVGLRPGVQLVDTGSRRDGVEYWRLEVAGQCPPHPSTFDVYERDPCVYCGDKAQKRTLDHIVPKTRGGHNRWHNLAPACYGCNQAKGSQSLVYFLATDNIERARKRGVFEKWRQLPRHTRGQRPNFGATILERVNYGRDAYSARDRASG